MISIGFYGHDDDREMWRQRLTPLLSDFDIINLESDAGMKADIALVWAPPRGALAQMPHLRGIIMQGQGVDHMMGDDTTPRSVPLVRLVDPDMSDALSHWAILNALDMWRDGAQYRAQQAERIWKPIEQRPATGAVIGIMGVGAIGNVIATRFASLGFKVKGWARTRRTLEHVEMFAGMDELPSFLSQTDIVVSVLPLTPATSNIMNATFFDALADGAFIINGGRGGQLVEDDLLVALDSGKIGGAALDVFVTEPLPATHAFWTHPKIRVWPHVAAQTNPQTAARQVAAAITDIMAGEEPANKV
ncbi:glyoxylate/hydroxypyruvate reductase A, partial [Candidatus Puniceispirillum sp.]|uniref:2-hydroxyacid dehydrogenase n=1 Tax=Candidatus Puniceispirillum sp. TaxID=2026719 RepID=UPI001EC37437|nr:glyoxylate/hydroxypyruvate reductase A [Candidatus Puniceispirillum sp.]